MVGCCEEHSHCFWASIILCVATLILQVGLCIFGNYCENRLSEPYDKTMDILKKNTDSTLEELGEPFDAIRPYMNGLTESGKKSIGVAAKGIAFVVCTLISWLFDFALYMKKKHVEESVITKSDERVLNIALAISAVIPIVFGAIDYLSWMQFF